MKSVCLCARVEGCRLGDFLRPHLQRGFIAGWRRGDFVTPAQPGMAAPARAAQHSAAPLHSSAAQRAQQGSVP